MFSILVGIEDKRKDKDFIFVLEIFSVVREVDIFRDNWLEVTGIINCCYRGLNNVWWEYGELSNYFWRWGSR